VTKKIPLEEWAQARYEPPPSIHTLRKWARECRIFPLPEKVGRAYYVEQDARYIDPNKYGSTAA
jgi:hypothetical protein